MGFFGRRTILWDMRSPGIPRKADHPARDPRVEESNETQIIYPPPPVIPYLGLVRFRSLDESLPRLSADHIFTNFLCTMPCGVVIASMYTPDEMPLRSSEKRSVRSPASREIVLTADPYIVNTVYVAGVARSNIAFTSMHPCDGSGNTSSDHTRGFEIGSTGRVSTSKGADIRAHLCSLITATVYRPDTVTRKD